MYAVGTSILYGRTEVCKVEGIGTPPFQKDDRHTYYTLRSVFSTSGELTYVPVDTAVVRPLIGRGEAADYLAQVPELRPKAFNSKNRQSSLPTISKCSPHASQRTACF